MKKFLLYPFLVILGLLFSGSFLLSLVLFFEPGLIINPRSFDLFIKRTNFLKEWSWERANFNIHWNRWNERQLQGYFNNLCFDYEDAGLLLSSCFEKFSWDFNLYYSFREGFQLKAQRPVVIRSEQTKVSLVEREKEEQIPGDPPDIWAIWQIIWGKLIPPLDFKFKEIIVNTYESQYTFEFSLSKDKRELAMSSLGLNLHGTPDGLTLVNAEDYIIPAQFGTKQPLKVQNLKLSALINTSGISLILFTGIEDLTIGATSFIGLPLEGDLSSIHFRKQLLLATSAEITLPKIKNNLKKFAPEPFNVLPAPLNAMDGVVKLTLETESSAETNSVLIKALTDINLAGTKQVLKMGIKSDVELGLINFTPGQVTLGLDFHKVALKLPRLAKTSRPPQFFPDARIKTEPAPPPDQARQAEEARPLIFHLQAKGEEALSIITNLLDEPLRLNFDLFISDATIQEGHLDILALKTTIFRRPIEVPYIRLTFDHPRVPVLEGTIVFPLPEYEITLTLEGPISSPRHSLRSNPPLPQNDIYAVLLFGRPMSELGTADSSAASTTTQLLSQGILSLSVLYFLAGSPVEYLGFDPQTGEAMAQIGLGARSSVRVGGGAGSFQSSIRRSLGRGWYIDTSVQDANRLNATQERTYGVMLERIIAY
jgi:hypothetical protein